MNKLAVFSGLLAVLGAIIAILISAPFSTAYFLAYGNSVGESTPTWLSLFERAYPTLLNFARRQQVYQTYGRFFFLAIMLTVPGPLRLRRRIGMSARVPRWGWRIFFGGVLFTTVGIFGDYCCNQSGFWVSTGFGFELLGILVLWAGAAAFGFAALKEGNVPRWVGILMICIPLFGIRGIGLLGHIPSGPLLGYFIFWLVAGTSLILDKGIGSYQTAGSQ